MSSTLIIEQHEMEEGKTTEIDKEIESAIDVKIFNVFVAFSCHLLYLLASLANSYKWSVVNWPDNPLRWQDPHTRDIYRTLYLLYKSLLGKLRKKICNTTLALRQVVFENQTTIYVAIL